MAVQGKQFLDAACWIYQNNSKNEEICYRCSISRAYYAAFHITKKYFKLAPRTRHSDVVKVLKNEKRSIGEQLFLLKQERVDADYELSKNISQTSAVRSFDKAKKIIEYINKKNG